MLQQELWSRGYGWHGMTRLKTRSFRDWKSGLMFTCCTASLICSKEIITLVDASKEAYGSVVYILSAWIREWSSYLSSGGVEVRAAFMGLRLTQSIIQLQVLDIPMQDVSVYSDSMDVLWWIRGRGKDLPCGKPNRWDSEWVGPCTVATGTHSQESSWSASVDRRPSQLADSTLWASWVEVIRTAQREVLSRHQS